MTERDDEMLVYYRRHRIEDQLDFYRNRGDEFDRATGQAMAIAATLLGFAAAASALAGTDVAGFQLWAALATILPAMSSALAAYSALHAFEQQSKIYADAVRAVHAAARPVSDPDAPEREAPALVDVAELVRRVETALRQEHAQWGQLTTQVQIIDGTRGGGAT